MALFRAGARNAAGSGGAIRAAPPAPRTALPLLLAASLVHQAAAQFNFNMLDPGRIAQSLQQVGREEGHKVVEALESQDAGKAVVEALAGRGAGTVAEVLRDATAGGAEQVARSATPLAASAGAVAAEAAARAATASRGAGGGSNATAAARQVPQDQHSEVEEAPTEARGADAKVAEALHALGGGLEKAAKATGIEDEFRSGRAEKDLASAVTGALPKNIAAMLGDEQLKQDVADVLRQSAPKIGDVLQHASAQQVEAAIKGTDPRDIEEVLVALERYRWWSAHWHWVVATLVGAVVALLLSVQVVRRLCRPSRRSQQQTLLMDAEINMWVRAGTRLAEKPSQEESSEASFQQF